MIFELIDPMFWVFRCPTPTGATEAEVVLVTSYHPPPSHPHPITSFQTH